MYSAPQGVRAIRAILPVRARVAVYAVAIGFELGLDRCRLDVLRRLAEVGDDADPDDEFPMQHILQIAREFSDWDDQTSPPAAFDEWLASGQVPYREDVKVALERVRRLIQPMNRSTDA